MRHSPFETAVGFLVLIAAIAFGAYALSNQGFWQAQQDTYVLEARFDTIGGVTTGTDVKISGVKVGRVSGFELDPLTFEAALKIEIPSKISLPTDSAIRIASDGLLGGSHILIEPGYNVDMFKEGDAFELTYGATNLMDLISGAVFGGLGGKGEAQASDDGFGADDLGADDLGADDLGADDLGNALDSGLGDNSGGEGDTAL